MVDEGGKASFALGQVPKQNLVCLDEQRDPGVGAPGRLLRRGEGEVIQQPLKPGKKFLQMLIGLLSGDGLDLGENRVLGIKEGGLRVLNGLIELCQQLGVKSGLVQQAVGPFSQQGRVIVQRGGDAVDQVVEGGSIFAEGAGTGQKAACKNQDQKHGQRDTFHKHWNGWKLFHKISSLFLR